MDEFSATPVAGMSPFEMGAAWLRENEPPEVLQDVQPAVTEFMELYADVGTMVEMANSGKQEEWWEDWEERYGPAWEELEEVCPESFGPEDFLDPTGTTAATPEP